MFNVCINCGQYRVDKEIKSQQGKTFAICPECNYSHEFLQLPLFIVTGASGVGKSTAAYFISTLSKDYVPMETDILWDNRYNTPDTDYREYRELWLRMAKNISQADKPVILCGTAMPDQLESCVERRYFTSIHYLALVCESEELTQRLLNRPLWRNSSNKEFINGMISYNNWLLENGEKNNPVIDLLDTTNLSEQETAEKILLWTSSKGVHS